MIRDNVNSYSNVNAFLFDCQLNSNQINYFHEFIRDNLTKAQFRVFKALMELMVKHGNRGVFPSLDLLASMAKCVKSTVQVAISTLKRLNIIATEYRGFQQTLIFRMHQFYYKKRREFASLVKTTVDLSLFFLLLSKPKKENRYLLKAKVEYLSKHTFSGDKIIMFQLSEEQFKEIRQQPGWVYEKCLMIYQKKIKEGAAICNEPNYFMGIFRQEAAKAAAVPHSTVVRQPAFKPKDPEMGKPKEFVRPQHGPYSIYKPEPPRAVESDFEMALKMQLSLKKNPNPFLQAVADTKLSFCTPVEQQQIREIVAATNV